MSFNVFTRSKSDRMISGVCGGIARTYRFDAVVVRGVFVVLGLVNIGIAAIIYVAAIFLIPEEIPTVLPGTQRPGWRYDPWTGESLVRAPTEDVIVDTAPPVFSVTESAASAAVSPGTEAGTDTSPDHPRAPERPNDDEV